MDSRNPAFRQRAFERVETVAAHEAMTIDGTVRKTLFLIVLAMAAGTITWSQYFSGSDAVYPIMIGSVIVGLILAIATIMKPAWAPVTAPLYAIFEGLFLGAISAVYHAAYEGLPLKAIGLTLGVLLVMLALYATRTIRVTEKLRMGIIAATAAVFLVYLVSFVLGFFGVQVPLIHDGGPISILFSLVVVGIAAFNLLLDFDFIEYGSKNGVHRVFEWYGAFGLLVTLIWLYLEILRLLGYLSRD